MPRKSFTTTIDDKIQDDFKASCAESGEKMNDVLEAFMLEFISGKYEIEKKMKITLKKSKK